MLAQTTHSNKYIEQTVTHSLQRAICKEQPASSILRPSSTFHLQPTDVQFISQAFLLIHIAYNLVPYHELE